MKGTLSTTAVALLASAALLVTGTIAAPAQGATSDSRSHARPDFDSSVAPSSNVSFDRASHESSKLGELDLISKVLKIYREDEDDTDSATGSKARRKTTKKRGKRTRKRTRTQKPPVQEKATDRTAVLVISGAGDHLA